MRETHQRSTFDIRQLWAVLRSLLGMVTIFGVLMSILPTLKLATGAQ